MIDPAKINHDLSLAFGGFEFEPSFPTFKYQNRKERYHRAGPLDYFHSAALAMELAENVCKKEGWMLARANNGEYHFYGFGITACEAEGKQAPAEAICFALHAAGIQLGLIKGDV